MRCAFGVGVDILCGLDDFGYEVGLEGFPLGSGVSDKAVDLANAPTQLGVVAIFDLVVGSG